MPDAKPAPAPPATRTVLVLGRPEGGLPDEEGQRAPGGLCWYAGGVEHRAEPGDMAEMPIKIASEFISAGFAVDPASQPPASLDDKDGE